MTGTVREYLYAGGEAPTAMRARQADGSYKNYFFVTNTHGDVVAVTDRDGVIVNRYAYGPWGEANRVSEQVHQPFRYAGYRYEDGFDLYYLRARWYDGGTGRFLSRDDWRGTSRNLRSLNRYIYAACAPPTMVDPGGKSPRCAGRGDLLDSHALNAARDNLGNALAARSVFPDVPLEVILNTIYTENGKFFVRRIGGQIGYKFGGDFNVPPMMASRNMARRVGMDEHALQDRSYNILVGTAFLSLRHRESPSGINRPRDEYWTMVFSNYVNEYRDPAEWDDEFGGLGENSFINYCARLQTFRQFPGAGTSFA